MISKFNARLFDLEPRDIRMYETMLELESAASIRSLAETVNLNRGTAFEVIKKLVKKGLVTSHFKNKRKYYAALPPDALLTYAGDRQSEMSQQLQVLDTYVKELRNKKTVELSGQFTQFYDGEEEIAALLRDVLNTAEKLQSKEYCVISSAEIRNHLYSKFRNFTRQRIKRGIYTRVIAIGQGGDEVQLAERRFLSAERIPACYVIVYGNKVAQISLSERGNIQAAVVQNEGVAQLQQLIFDQLWLNLAP